VTAIVELKKESESCQSFSIYESKKIQKPNFRSAHGPLGQVMLYSLDVWHCLARRGVSVTSVPAVVLAGKSEETDSSLLCCVEAQIHIPEYCGNAFLYSIERIVSFDGTAGFKSNKKALNEELQAESRNSRDRRALAIYIRTMCIGLERAVLVSNYRNMSDTVFPKSLCSTKNFKGIPDALLIASPIPREGYTSSSAMYITHGEFFELKKPIKGVFSEIEDMNWFVDVKRDDAEFTTNCLVKISCMSVHNTHVPLYLCDKALTKLYSSEDLLKNEISRVLLGFSSTNGKSLVLIMNDLTVRSDNFMILHLDHQKIRSEKKLTQLWTAFCGFATTLLIPMAKKGVIHVDIRSTSEITYNILYQYHSSTNTIELRLIDFDSLISFSSAANASLSEQDYAIKATVELESAYRYLFWQVLWIAYSWHPSIASYASNDRLKNPHNSNNFVEFLFDDDYYVNFKCWLGENEVKSLEDTNMAESCTAATIETVLEVLTRAFGNI
jgi:hypothetical protein